MELPRAFLQHPWQRNFHVRTVAKASLPRHSTDLVGLWGHCNAYHGLEAELGVRGCLEGEFLQQGGEEEEELGTGQQLAQAGTLPCGDSDPQHPQTVLVLLKMLLPALRTVLPHSWMSFSTQTKLPINGFDTIAWSALKLHDLLRTIHPHTWPGCAHAGRAQQKELPEEMCAAVVGSSC